MACDDVELVFGRETLVVPLTAVLDKSAPFRASQFTLQPDFDRLQGIQLMETMIASLHAQERRSSMLPLCQAWAALILCYQASIDSTIQAQAVYDRMCTAFPDGHLSTLVVIAAKLLHTDGALFEEYISQGFFPLTSLRKCVLPFVKDGQNMARLMKTAKQQWQETGKLLSGPVFAKLYKAALDEWKRKEPTNTTEDEGETTDHEKPRRPMQDRGEDVKNNESVETPRRRTRQGKNSDERPPPNGDNIRTPRARKKQQAVTVHKEVKHCTNKVNGNERNGEKKSSHEMTNEAADEVHKQTRSGEDTDEKERDTDRRDKDDAERESHTQSGSTSEDANAATNAGEPDVQPPAHNTELNSSSTATGGVTRQRRGGRSLSRAGEFLASHLSRFDDWDRSMLEGNILALEDEVKAKENVVQEYKHQREALRQEVGELCRVNTALREQIRENEVVVGRLLERLRDKASNHDEDWKEDHGDSVSDEKQHEVVQTGPSSYPLTILPLTHHVDGYPPYSPASTISNGSSQPSSPVSSDSAENAHDRGDAEMTSTIHRSARALPLLLLPPTAHKLDDSEEVLEAVRIQLPAKDHHLAPFRLREKVSALWNKKWCPGVIVSVDRTHDVMTLSRESATADDLQQTEDYPIVGLRCHLTEYQGEHQLSEEERWCYLVLWPSRVPIDWYVESALKRRRNRGRPRNSTDAQDVIRRGDLVA
jgi:hypothetical protein